MDTEKISTFNGFQSFQIFQKVFETENFEKKGRNINQKEKPKDQCFEVCPNGSIGISTIVLLLL